ncbi:MAG TPA: cytochrome c oxidase subunit II [Bacteroidales bacterium]|nr:cytochrome c oxidase subunit II [Bacteroidales bacterium]
MFSGASNFTDNVDRTFMFTFYVSMFFLVGVTIVMLYFVYKYHKKRRPKSEHIEGNVLLEVIWTVIPVILVGFMFVFGWTNWKRMKSPPKNAFLIKSTARMWSWSFEYPNGKVTDTLYVPQHKPVKVDVTSADVIHSMYIPAFRLKQDMVLGSTNFVWFVAEKTGIYNLFCAEYCGLRHSYMTTAVVVMPDKEFNSWYNDTSQVKAAPGKDKAASPGQQLVLKNGCIACHSIDGSQIVGPSFKGIYGEKTTVTANGKEQQVTVDDAYILESLMEPNAKVVKGFQSGLMQPYKGTISNEQAKQIADYIKSLK